MEAIDSMRLRLAAVDLDGTLLGPGGSISPANRDALSRLSQRGFLVVLASGRHPANISCIAREFSFVEWSVGCQGCEVADVHRTRILERAFLPLGRSAAILSLGREFGFGVVGYSVLGELTPTMGPEIERYEGISGTHVDDVEAGDFNAESLMKVLWIGAEQQIRVRYCDGLDLGGTLGVSVVQSHPSVLEFLPQGISKATGVARLAREYDLTPDDVVAFGDAENDLPLFGWASVSVAMPHACSQVRNRATFVAPDGTLKDAFARGVAALLGRKRGVHVGRRH